jgi:cytochrome c553
MRRALASAACLAASFVRAADVAPADLEFFEKKIRPVLAEHCYECHGAEKQKGGLRLDSREALRVGGDSGPAIVPGEPGKSLLIRAVQYLDKDLAMPPSKDGSKKLPAAVIADLESWVQRGAPDPRDGAATVTNKPAFDFEAERKKWAYRKPERTPLPAVKNATWVKTPVDTFVLAKLEAAGLAPAPVAEPRTLIRRITFDLTGLPPTPDEVAAFEKACASDRQKAIATFVERLLASPAYGEKWGRHWLDVVRYADSLDSRGSGKDGDIVDAWRYRDWVVSAFNQDLPYDEFIRQQIAGDILAERAWDPAKATATSVFAIGNWGNGDSDKQKVYTDIVDDQLDVVGRAFLGLTLTCARCHDHKFDPITTADYYSLAGFFFSSRILEKFQPPTEGEKLMRIPLESPAERARRGAPSNSSPRSKSDSKARCNRPRSSCRKC